MRMIVRAPIAAAAFLLGACTDRAPSTAPDSEIPGDPPVLATLRGTVDVASGTLTFEPVSATGSASLDRGPGVSAAIYGNQGVTVRIYNTPVTLGSSPTPGKERYSAQVGVRNLLAHSIGDEQAGPASQNNGIFVFVSNGPTVTGTSSACSPACTVNVVGQHGIFAFSAPGQRYWFWSEQLTAAGQPGDTTLNRKTWTFEADTQVTTFQFDVLVSAAWPAPIETRWKVNYGADSLPNNGTEPIWLRTAVGAATTEHNQPSQGMIRMIAAPTQRLTYTRADSLNTNSNAYIEARFQLEPPLALTNPEVSFGLDDRTKFIAVGLTSTQAGFLTSTLSFQVGGSVSTNTTNLHVYQIRKFGADSVVLYIDGVRQLNRLYSAFPAPLSLSTGFGFYFGPLGTGAAAVSLTGNRSAWDYVIYEIGVTQP